MKNSAYFILVPTLFASLVANAGPDAAKVKDNRWNADNNPANFSRSYQYNFYNLPLSGSLEASAKGWSDSYWPTIRGSILDRWQQPALAYKYKDYKQPSPGIALSLSPGEINLLSPAEKFDLARGQTNFPLSNELKKLKTKAKEWWRGICNGWTRASLYIDEPKAIVFKSPITGQKIPFASGDVKALLDYYYAMIDDEPVRFIGAGDHSKHWFDGNGKNDLNAGAFHVALANQYGLMKKGIGFDRDPSEQVWNQPILGFTSVVDEDDTDLTAGHSKEAVREVSVTTTVTYVNELYNTTDEDQETDKHVMATVQAQGIGNQHTKTIEYKYVLELDRSNLIIGGYWVSEHPDFLWKQEINLELMSTDTAKNSSNDLVYDEADNWTLLREIVRQSTGQ